MKLRDDKSLWLALVAIGVAATVNSIVATLLRPNSFAHHPQVINVHWITTIILAAGLAPLGLHPHQTLKSHTMVVATNIVSGCVCFCCALADAANIVIVTFGRRTPRSPLTSFFIAEDETTTRERLLVYNCIDFALCSLAACMSCEIISTRLKANIFSHSISCRKMAVLGVVLIIFSVFRIANHIFERQSLVQHQHAIFVDMYTLDEFSWLAVNLCTGVMVFLSARGSRLVQAVAFGLAGATIYPSFFYTWLNYRILAATYSKVLRLKAIFSMMLSVPQIGCLLVVFLELTANSFKRESIQLNLGGRYRKPLLTFAILFGLIAIVMMSIDIYAVYASQFHRVLQGTEQKVTFLSAFMALFVGLTLLPSYGFLGISASMVVGVLTANATYLQLFSFLYLTFNRSSISDSHTLFFPYGNYSNVAGLKGDLAAEHATDTLCNAAALILSLSYVGFAMWVARCNREQPDIVDDSTEDEEKSAKFNRQVRKLGVLMLIGALAVLCTTLIDFAATPEMHPVFTIYVELYHIVLAIGIVSFALFQVLVSEHVARSPIFCTALLILSTITSLDVITQIDYRDTGEDLPFAWDVHVIVDYTAFYAHFLTIILLIKYSPGQQLLSAEHENVLEFNNPLADSAVADGDGYIQLRTNDDGFI